MKKKAFTLIELIAVLVILAILALIVTPLVMNIIKKAKDSANKRSIDAYGRSVELAIATHLLDTGRFPTDVSELTIEYSGSEVVCETTQLNSDSSVYLAGCRVAGRSVDYTYGEDKNPPTYEPYSVGDEVSYNNVDYYVIKDSDECEENVILLKKEPLTVAEVNLYGGVGTENNHVNKYTNLSQGTADNHNGYGGMAYYTSSTCGYPNDTSIETGCISAYADSDIKYVVDAWAQSKAPLAAHARLISQDDLTDNLGYEKKNEGTVQPSSGGTTPSWVYGNYHYWTMTPYNDSTRFVRAIGSSGILSGDNHVVYDVGNQFGGRSLTVRPVITLKKSSLN